MVRETYRKSSNGAFQPNKFGSYDGDHEEITTFTKNSKTGKYETDIHSKYDKNGKEVKTYKYCEVDKEYRRHVGGKFDKDGKKLKPRSNLTEALNHDRTQERGTGSRPEGSQRPEITGTSLPRSAQVSTSRTLTPRQIEQQRMEETQASELYHDDAPPPSYSPRRFRIGPNNPMLQQRGVRRGQQVPEYQPVASTYSKPTGQSHRLGHGNEPRMEDFGGRRDTAAPQAYSSSDDKTAGRHGRRPLTSDEEPSHSQTSSSQDMFKFSESSSSSDTGNKPMSEAALKDAKKKAPNDAKKAEVKRTEATKVEEARVKEIRDGKKPVKLTRNESTSSGSVADMENSPPKATLARRTTGDKALVSRPKPKPKAEVRSSRPDRETKESHHKRETSAERKTGKAKVAEVGDASRARKQSRPRRNESNGDDLYDA
ncbi:hypothetical protein SBOR_4729 [Sclerotinia borealis F-4128]|uniref:Uncharacterized protein n=1 Tax=Sclerotinia borealis (strain F-4128) TaxID=1432307 RepID=W9CG19_SCLBF|nr:hypothetical protein SBOR_4729 [Sclerotinia borealis F-4128]